MSTFQHLNLFPLLPDRWKSLHSPVGIATGYGLDGRGVEVRVSAGVRLFPLYLVHTGSGVHPANYPVGTGGSFPREKWLGREADYPPPTSPEVKNTWVYTSSPTYVFIA
jgi:hypothetical protein